MPRQIADQKITTPTQRAKLAPRRKPYFRRLSDSLAIGYRRTATLPGVWVVRQRQGDGSYTERRLDGVAPDDVVAANGRDVLTFDQACRVARDALTPAAEEITLEKAAEAWRDGKQADTDKASAKTQVRNTAARIVAGFPAGQLLDRLTVQQIREWRDGHLIEGADEDRNRARRSTANRELAAFKAICNKAVADHALTIARPWDQVSKFSRAESFGKRVRVLDKKERKAWLKAAPDKPTGDMLRALLGTGCRSGELVWARVRDLSGRRLTVTGKTGTRTLILSPAMAVFLAGLAEGVNDPDRALLAAPDGGRWGVDGLIDAIAAASAGAKLDGVTAYAARHTYITDHLAAGVPVVAVAKQCGTSADMIERTYANFIATDLERWFGAEVAP